MNLRNMIAGLCQTAPALLAMALAGCSSTGSQTADYDPINPGKPFVFPGQPGGVPVAGAPEAQPAAPASQPQPGPPLVGNPQLAPVVIPDRPLNPQPAPTVSASTLRVGDFITVSFTDTPLAGVLPDRNIQIGEDGTVTLPLNVRVQALGKTPRQLEQEIRSEYVPKLYRYLTVTVKADQRAYYVGGEVKVPNRLVYVGDITVLRAIQSAGDFTEFANRKKIELIRENGEKYTIDWNKAIKNPKLDLPVYPNDQIIVHKRFIW